MTLAIDADSWDWTFDATCHVEAWPLLRPTGGTPIEAEARINGHTWRVKLEPAKRTRSFGDARVSVTGRGISSVLDVPASATRTFANATAMTAQQLMTDALTLNGVSLGWLLDWKITDWLIPAGAWSFQGTPIAAALRIAEAAGAIVQAHPSSKTLAILPRYPTAPWNWNASSVTPDIIIPIDVMETDSLEPSVKPDYDAVVLAGETQGVVARVVRSGFAGDVMAPTFTHPLMSHADVARQKGLAILGAGGAQARIGFSLPVTEDTGLVSVGMLAEVPEPGDEWRGLVRGFSIDARRDQGPLTVWQHIEAERHYYGV
jgi:hypothetical protein